MQFFYKKWGISSCPPCDWLSTVGSRTFPVAGPQTWNDLPEDVTSAESLTTFRRLLKTHLFRKSSWLLAGHQLTVSGRPSSSSATLGHLKIVWLIDWLTPMLLTLCEVTYHRCYCYHCGDCVPAVRAWSLDQLRQPEHVRRPYERPSLWVDAKTRIERCWNKTVWRY